MWQPLSPPTLGQLTGALASVDHRRVMASLNELPAAARQASLVDLLRQATGRVPRAQEIQSLALMPATTAAYAAAHRQFVASAVTLPLWSIPNLYAHVDALLAKGTWRKGTSVATRIRQLSALATRAGCPFGPAKADLERAFLRLAVYQETSQVVRHSVRRGVLQHLDAADVGDAVVLAASQHTNAMALQRYLNRATKSRRDLMLQSQARC